MKQLPNIVLIMADDMGYGDVGCYNPESKIPTPNIDALAAAGARFTDAHSSSAVCTPSRYGLLTGRYCWRTELKRGVILNDHPLLINPRRLTLASLLRRRNYASACIGKWHLGLGSRKPVDFSDELKPGPLELGFDYCFILPGSLNMAPFCFVENHHTVGTPSIPKPPDMEGQDGLMVPGWRHQDVGPKLTRRACAWLRQQITASPNQPFFLYLPTASPHRPCVPPDFIEGRSKAGPRGDMCAEFDWTVGEVVRTLKELDQLQNTLIVVTSDNGAIPGQQIGGDNVSLQWELYGHKSCGDWRGYKTHIWEGGHRVPFIVHWPGHVPAGYLCDELICLTDMFRTFAALTGQDVPASMAEDSVNVLPALLGRRHDAPLREFVVLHSNDGMLAIRRGKWKLVRGLGSGGQTDRLHLGPQPEPLSPGEQPEGQLYDLETSPQEQRNLWCRYPEIVRELLQLLAACENRS